MQIRYVFDSSCDMEIQKKIMMVENNSTGSTTAETISRVLQNVNRYGLTVRNIENTAEVITFYVENLQQSNEPHMILG